MIMRIEATRYPSGGQLEVGQFQNPDAILQY